MPAPASACLEVYLMGCACGSEWSGLLEANSPTFGVTFLMQLYYSQALQKVRPAHGLTLPCCSKMQACLLFWVYPCSRHACCCWS